ncbi:hypothetical protein DL89DRAFT_180231 [Linderina pennispora]|uniref:Uncharacterized protein n=1 Tax=Linderina pennispora TaxID=61395 RepID=A0A1Y1W4Y9_9FUNG|nr:uncharacterized protein DL89DRAFT_180231 [Linderina pennispora]ORX68587.1 hypothetical protein DL89DRAFT_180231 [Linderina pennispora]
MQIWLAQRLFIRVNRAHRIILRYFSNKEHFCCTHSSLSAFCIFSVYHYSFYSFNSFCESAIAPFHRQSKRAGERLLQQTMSDKTSEKPLSFKRKATVIDIPTTLQTPEEAQQRRQFIEYNGRSILPQTRSSRGHPYSRDIGQTASGGTGRQRTNRVKEIGGRTRQLNLRPSSEASGSKGVVQSRVSQFESMAPQSKIPRLNLQRSSAATSKPSDSQDGSVMHIDDSDADPEDGATAEAKKLIEVDDVPSPTSARDLTRAASVGRGSPLLEVTHKANESVSRVALRATQYGLGSTAAKVQGFSKQYPGSGTNARLASLRDPSNSLQRMQYSSPLSSLPGNSRGDCMDTASIKGLMKPPKVSIAAGLQPKQQHDSHSSSSSSIASSPPPRRGCSPPRLIKPAVNSSHTSATGAASGYSTSARSRRKAAEIYTEYQSDDLAI